VEQGDIVILYGLHSNADGHIGLATGNQNSTQFELLEQNGQTGNGSGLEGDAIRTRYIDKSRIAGVLRPKTVIPPPVTYSVTYSGTTARDLLTTKNTTNWYELTGEFSPLTTLPEGTRVPVAGIAHWSSSTGEAHDFYMTPDDFGNAGNTQLPNNNNGISTDDLKEVPVPKPAPPPPGHPVPVPKAETYQLVTSVMYFQDTTSALMLTTPAGFLGTGTYYVFSRAKGMLNLSRDNMKDQGLWINPKQNVPPAAVEAVAPSIPETPATEPDPTPPLPVDDSWKACYPLFADREPTRLKSRNNIPVKIKALDGKAPEYITLPAHKELDIISFFVKGDVTYYRDDTLDQAKRFYALSATLFPDPYKPFDRNHDGDVTISEFIDYAGKYGGQLFKSGTAVITKAAKSIKTQRFIDGFRDGVKKDKVR
jgi:hypothetical protein